MNAILRRIKHDLQRGLQRLSAPLEKKVGKHVIRKKIELFKTDQRTLDLGCGQSPSAPFFPNRIGVDIAWAPGIDVIADAHHLPFAAASFKQIVCSEVLEHLSHTQKSIEEMGRVLDRGGRVIVTAPFIYPVHEAPDDYQRFTEFGLKHLFTSSGFSVEKVEALYTEEQTLAILLQRIAYQRQDSLLRRYSYLLIAHFIFRFFRTNAPRYQDIERRTPGPFMTAGYLLVAYKPESNG
jgi:SAM-dependent methyltransferase